MNNCGAQMILINQDEAINLGSHLLAIQNDGYLNQRDAGQFRLDAQKFIDADIAYYTSNDVFMRFLEYVTRLNKKSIPCDQTPRNIFYIKEILELYPTSKIINMVRDPRDVLLSQKLKWRRRLIGRASAVPMYT